MATITLSLGSYSLDAITEIKIYRNTSSTYAQPEYLIATLSGTAKEYIDNDVIEDQNYRYLIVATTTEGEVIESYTQYIYPTLPYSEKPIIPTPTLTVNDRTISGDAITEIGDHIRTDWLLERTDGVGGEFFLNRGDYLKTMSTWKNGTYTVQARYTGSDHSTEWSNSVEYTTPSTNYHAELLEVLPSSQFISGSALANHIGLTEGSLQYSNTDWLKFKLDGEIIVIPMKPIRAKVLWKHIYLCGAVYGTDDFGIHGGIATDDLVKQDAKVDIGGLTYRVTLMKGVDADPLIFDTLEHDAPLTHKSEWNRLMYPIHSGIHTDPDNPDDPSVPFNQWASYSDADLILTFDSGMGHLSLMQESMGDTIGSSVVSRGGYGITSVGGIKSNNYNNLKNGWRPALRLVQ